MLKADEPAERVRIIAEVGEATEGAVTAANKSKDKGRRQRPRQEAEISAQRLRPPKEAEVHGDLDVRQAGEVPQAFSIKLRYIKPGTYNKLARYSKPMRSKPRWYMKPGTYTKPAWHIKLMRLELAWNLGPATPLIWRRPMKTSRYSPLGKRSWASLSH